MAAVPTPNSSSLSLKDYLKRYESGAEDQKKKKKKKKKKEKPKPSSAGGILVVDEDPVWQKPVQIELEESDSSGEEKPQIDEDIEVKRMKRLEAIRARKPYHAISEDGSGWVSISDPLKPLNPVEISRDLSPPRQGRKRFDTPSPERNEKPSTSQNSDLSPPRQRRRRADTPSPEPQKELRANVLPDISPPRRRATDDLSPPRRGRQTLTPDPDLSPPPRSRKDDLSPPRRSRKNDLSPPRVSSRPQHPTENFPPRRRKRDMSPDISPPRRTRHFSPDTAGPPASPRADLSPPRRGGKRLSEDLSPPRRIHPKPPEAIVHQSSAADISPPRKSRREAPVKELKAGLVSAEELAKENEKKRKEAMSRFASMDPHQSGKGAEPVFRDKQGKRISKEELLKTQEEEKPKEKKLEWGKGLAQKREAEARAKELELEKAQPFARTRDDPELDKMLKERIRWGDPMAHLVKGKSSELVLEDLGDNEKMKESGFIIPQSIPSHSWIKRGIDFPPNRYGIKPGRHWDGVDRSNGFEKEMFKRQNEKRATEREAYLWSVSDM